MTHYLALLFIVLSIVSLLDLVGAQSAGALWCVEGSRKDYNPVQCPDQTTECFAAECVGIEEAFLARGCGVSLATHATGLANESCHQAEEVCQYLGGTSICRTCNDLHLCNSSTTFNFFPIVFLVFCLVSRVCLQD